jgi:hypothetical protein
MKPSNDQFMAKSVEVEAGGGLKSKVRSEFPCFYWMVRSSHGDCIALSGKKTPPSLLPPRMPHLSPKGADLSPPALLRCIMYACTSKRSCLAWRAS